MLKEILASLCLFMSIYLKMFCSIWMYFPCILHLWFSFMAAVKKCNSFTYCQWNWHLNYPK